MWWQLEMNVKCCELKSHPLKIFSSWLFVTLMASLASASQEGFLDILKEVGMLKLGQCISKGQSSTTSRTGILVMAQQCSCSMPCSILIHKRNSPQIPSFSSHWKDCAHLPVPFAVHVESKVIFKEREALLNIQRTLLDSLFMKREVWGSRKS